jgi:Family of unknown function (DUF6510)
MLIEEMRLDGNAAAGALREVFTRDVTAAMATCAACGKSAPMGALLEYGHTMGIVLRCPTCNTVVFRMSHTPGWFRLDASGMSFLMIPESMPTA